MTPRRGRGRLDNGLDATLWSPLRDVDPRIGEHLLDVLQAAGIAAYLEPSADVGEYTRTVFLPSPPSDRLFVDRARRVEARAVVDQNAPRPAEERTAAPRHEPAAVRREIDEDAEWARIVSAFEAEHGRAVVHDEPADAPPPPPHETAVLDRHAPQAADAGDQASVPLPEPAAVRREIDEDAEWARIVSAFEAEHGRSVVGDDPVDGPAPVPHETPILDRPDDHFEPPPPPPLPAPSPASLYAVLLVIAGVVLVGAPGLLRLSTDVGLIVGVAAITTGVALLVSRMRERSDDGDDGAVV